jgi:hypothetical protein
MVFNQQLANLLTHQGVENSMHWKFWLALCGILIAAIAILIGFNAGVIVSITTIVGVGIGSLTLFHTLERVPALEFNGLIKTERMVIPQGPRAGWYATKYSVRVRKTKGLGKAEECEGVISLIDSPLTNIRSRWLPDDVVLCNIGGHMDLIVFQTIGHTNEIVFSPVSLQREMAQGAFPLEPHLDRFLSIEVHTRNAKTPKPSQKTVREIMNEAKGFSLAQP